MELLHLPEHINRFEAAGSMLQSAVQRAAMAQAGAHKIDVKARQRKLYDLVDEVAAKARSMWRSELIPAIEDDDPDALADRLSDDKDEESLLSG